jgi:hypothetical protein
MSPQHNISDVPDLRADMPDSALLTFHLNSVPKGNVLHYYKLTPDFDFFVVSCETRGNSRTREHNGQLTSCAAYTVMTGERRIREEQLLSLLEPEKQESIYPASPKARSDVHKSPSQ